MNNSHHILRHDLTSMVMEYKGVFQDTINITIEPLLIPNVWYDGDMDCFDFESNEYLLDFEIWNEAFRRFVMNVIWRYPWMRSINCRVTTEFDSTVFKSMRFYPMSKQCANLTRGFYDVYFTVRHLVHNMNDCGNVFVHFDIDVKPVEEEVKV